MKKIGKGTYKTEAFPSIRAYASVVGKKEGQGPLGHEFDRIFQDMYAGESTWEKAESRIQKTVAQLALEKGKSSQENIDLIFAGDLLNQCTASAFGMRDFGIPYMGQYGACSTMVQTIIGAAFAIESGGASSCLCVTSSHFCAAERQYRYPLEYGGFRTPTAQWTVTGAGACILEPAGSGKKAADDGNGAECDKSQVVVHAVPGKIVDLGIKDANNMGAAMAPAAADTLSCFFSDTKTSPLDYDMIFTGDLGMVGGDILRRLLNKEGIYLGQRHRDCGAMIFGSDENHPCSKDCGSGGSGCGCCASVLCSHILNRMKKGSLNNVLVVATGALLSPTTSGQKESIPGIAHLIHLRNEAVG